MTENFWMSDIIIFITHQVPIHTSKKSFIFRQINFCHQHD